MYMKDTKENPCMECPLEEKIYQCCFRYPETGETAPLLLNDGRIIQACSNLTAEGYCSLYLERPSGCRDFICDRAKSIEESISLPILFNSLS